jgi:hypothetical protein
MWGKPFWSLGLDIFEAVVISFKIGAVIDGNRHLPEPGPWRPARPSFREVRDAAGGPRTAFRWAVVRRRGYPFRWVRRQAMSGAGLEERERHPWFAPAVGWQIDPHPIRTAGRCEIETEAQLNHGANDKRLRDIGCPAPRCFLSEFGADLHLCPCAMRR